MKSCITLDQDWAAGLCPSGWPSWIMSPPSLSTLHSTSVPPELWAVWCWCDWYAGRSWRFLHRASSNATHPPHHHHHHPFLSLSSQDESSSPDATQQKERRPEPGGERKDLRSFLIRTVFPPTMIVPLPTHYTPFFYTNRALQKKNNSKEVYRQFSRHTHRVLIRQRQNVKKFVYYNTYHSCLVMYPCVWAGEEVMLFFLFWYKTV